MRHFVAALVAPFLFISLSAAGVRPAAASCGAENCPLDHASRWDEASLSFEISLQYIDQNQPRVRNEDAVVGQIPADENEVRTVNRITVGRASYRWSAWSASLALPYFDRTHEHIADPLGAAEYLRWSYRGIGDLEGDLVRRFGSATGTRMFLSGGIKAPTGLRHVEAVDAEQPEPPARPGTGSWDLTLGAGIQRHLPVGAFYGRGGLPVRASVNGRWNGHGTDHYRMGNELTAHVGTDVPIVSWGAILFQSNLRVRRKDDVGDSDMDRDNTGSTSVYLSPGFRVAGKGTSLVAMLQIPVYQRVNGIQLVSKAHLFLGVTHAFAR